MGKCCFSPALWHLEKGSKAALFLLLLRKARLLSYSGFKLSSITSAQKLWASTACPKLLHTVQLFASTAWVLLSGEIFLHSFLILWAISFWKVSRDMQFMFLLFWIFSTHKFLFIPLYTVQKGIWWLFLTAFSSCPLLLLYKSHFDALCCSG